MKYRIRSDREVEVSFFVYLLLRALDAIDTVFMYRHTVRRKYLTPPQNPYHHKDYWIENWLAGIWLKYAKGNKFQQVIDKLDGGR